MVISTEFVRFQLAQKVLYTQFCVRKKNSCSRVKISVGFFIKLRLLSFWYLHLMVLMLVLKSRPFGIAFVFETILFVTVKQFIEKMPTNREQLHYAILKFIWHF